jgi:hypothetical protein
MYCMLMYKTFYLLVFIKKANIISSRKKKYFYPINYLILLQTSILMVYRWLKNNYTL